MKKFAIALFGISTMAGVNAFAETTDETSAAPVQQAAANYQCADGKAVTINYAFNETGLPTHAVFEVDGTAAQLRLDPEQSNATSLAFTSQDGYNLKASVPDENSPFVQSVTITSPTNEVMFQDCNATVDNT